MPAGDAGLMADKYNAPQPRQDTGRAAGGRAVKLSILVQPLELRTAHRIGKQEEYIEIVQWGRDSCWTIALFHSRGGGSWELRFVDDRPFHADVDPVLFMDLAKVGQALCRFLPQPEGEPR